MSTYKHRISILTFIAIFLSLNIIFTNTSLATHQCGNGICQPSGHHNETCSTCSIDCGVCNPTTPTPTQTTTPTQRPATPVSATQTPIPTTPSQTQSPNTPPPSTTIPSETNNPTQTTNPSSTEQPQGTNSESANNSDQQASIPAPTITLNVSMPTFTNQTNFSLSGNASGSVETIEFNLDNGQWQTASGTNSFVISINNLSEGAHTIYIRGKSTSGIYTDSSIYTQISFIVATTPPSVNVNLTNEPTDEAVITGSVQPALAGVRLVEISLDNGINWEVVRLNGNNFTFTADLEDGNYEVRVRATDVAGNVAITPSQTLIIDTIPPIFGSAIYSFGPIITKTPLYVSGNTSTITASFKGGPTQVSIKTTNSEFDLKAVSGSFLWTGNISLNPNDTYFDLLAVDGAGNTFQKRFDNIQVINSGRILNDTEQPILNSEVKLFSLDTDTKTWSLWDGTPFNQNNPQITNESGEFSLFVPPGDYYLEVTSSGYQKSQSYIFKINKPTLLSQDIMLKKVPFVNATLPTKNTVDITLPWLYIPNAFTLTANLSNENTSTNLNTNFDINLIDSNGKQVTSLQENKQFVFLNTWSPEASELASQITKLNKSTSLIVVFVQSNRIEIENFMRKGGYEFDYYIDPIGETANSLNIITSPTSFRLNNNQEIIYTDIDI